MVRLILRSNPIAASAKGTSFSILVNVLYGYSLPHDFSRHWYPSIWRHSYLSDGAANFSHIFFANDAMFFFQASTDSCAALSSLLDRFCNISGQMISLRKSYVKFNSNNPKPMIQTFKSLLNLESHSSLWTYLGASIDIQDKKSQHFTFLLDKVSNLYLESPTY